MTATDVPGDALVAELRSLGLPKVRVVDDLLGARVAPALRAAGMEAGPIVLMALRRPHDREPDPAADARPAGIDEAVAAWTLDWTEAGQPEEVVRQLVEVRRRLAQDGARPYLAGGLDCHASLFTSPGVAQVEDVHTRTVARGRGLAYAVIARAIADARAADPDAFVFLVAEPHATGLYEKLGFDEIGRCWEADVAET